MGETLINSNQIRGGGGSSKEIKILNVVQNGTLYRDGAVFSGFSNDNYLTLGARVDKGILSLDSSTSYKNFGLASSTADNWEWVFKVKIPSVIPLEYQPVFDDDNNTGYGTAIQIPNDITVFKLSLTNAESSIDIGSITSDKILSTNTIYYIKCIFTGSQYELYVSTTNTFDTTPDGILVSSTKLIERSNSKWCFGKNVNNRWQGSIDFSECYIKVNGEYWWKGVETI